MMYITLSHRCQRHANNKVRTCSGIGTTGWVGHKIAVTSLAGIIDTLSGLKLAYLIFSAAEQLSINLQAKDITVSKRLNSSCLLAKWLTSKQTEEAFESFYGGVVMASE